MMIGPFFEKGPIWYFDSLCPHSYGPLAQRLERPAHNRLVLGSNPGGPTARERGSGAELGPFCYLRYAKHRLVDLSYMFNLAARVRAHNRG